MNGSLASIPRADRPADRYIGHSEIQRGTGASFRIVTNR